MVAEEAVLVKVDIQVAARDAETRKMAQQLGKRHKWLAADISTNRHLSCVASLILRHLGLDINHQVMLYPDSSVHTHLQYTPVSWGPIYDRPVPLRDIYKMFGSPSKLHFLYHVITPETFSPPSKAAHAAEARQQHTDDDQGGQLLQPKQLNLLQAPAEQPQLQQMLQQQQQLIGFQADQLQQPQQAVVSSTWPEPLHSQPVTALAYQWPTQQYQPLQQFQEQYQQLCQPLIMARQQLPLRQLQDNTQQGQRCCPPQHTTACGQSLTNGWSADSKQRVAGQQNMQLILQHPSFPGGQQQQQQQRHQHQFSVMPGTSVPYTSAHNQQQQLQHNRWQQQGAAQHSSAWPLGADQQVQQPQLMDLQNGAMPIGSIMQQELLGAGQLQQPQQGQGGLFVPSLSAHHQQQQQQEEAIPLYSGSQLHVQEQHHQREASLQQAPSSQGATALRQPGTLTGPATMACVSYQSSQHSSGPRQLQAHVVQQQQLHHPIAQQCLQPGQHSGGAAAGSEHHVAADSCREERQHHLQQLHMRDQRTAGGEQQQQQQQQQQVTGNAITAAAAGCASTEVHPQQQHAPEMPLQPAAALQQAHQLTDSLQHLSAAQHRQPAPQPAAASSGGAAVTAERAAGNAAVRLTLKTSDGQSIDLPLSCSTENGKLVLVPQEHLHPAHKGSSSVAPFTAQLLALLGAAGLNIPIPSQPVGGGGGAAANATTPAADTHVDAHQRWEQGLELSMGAAAGSQGLQLQLIHQQQQQPPLANPEQHHSQAWQQQQSQPQQHALYSQKGQQQQKQQHSHSRWNAQPQERGASNAGAPAAAEAVADGRLSLSAAPVSSVMVSRSGVHSSAAAGGPRAMCHTSLAAGPAASPADVRSHCSSVSCGAGGHEGGQLHGSSRLSAGGGGNGSTLPDVNGSATRSSLPRQAEEQVASWDVGSNSQQQKQLQQQLAGRGVLQPRQLQMLQQPNQPRASSQQQQWQPQLQSVTEHHEAAAAADSSKRSGAAATPSAAGPDATQDMSGALNLQLEDSGDEQQPGDQEHPVVGASHMHDSQPGQDDGGAYEGQMEQCGCDRDDTPQHSQQQGQANMQQQSLLMLLQQEESRHEGSQKQPNQVPVAGQHRPQRQQSRQRLPSQQQHEGSQITLSQQHGSSQQHSQQSSQQRSQQQASQSQEYSQQQAHSKFQQCQGQQPSQAQSYSSMLAAISDPAAQRHSKAIKRPREQGSRSLVNIVGASAMPGMQPPSKRLATTRNLRRGPAQFLQLPASLRLPAEDALMLPSIVSKGSSFVGTWHGSTGRWDSRTEQTPLKPDELGTGGIFSVAELLRQQQQRRQRSAGGASSGGSMDSRPGGRRATPVVALASSQQQQQEQQPPAEQPLQGMVELQESGKLSQQEQQVQSEGEVSIGPSSNPGSTSLQGWCGATTAATAAAAAVSTGRAGADSAATGGNALGAISEQEEEVTGGQDVPENDGDEMVSGVGPTVEAVQQHASQSAGNAGGQIPDKDPIAQSQQQEQQQQRTSPDPWEGFQAAGAADGELEGRTPETFTEQQQQQPAGAARSADGELAAAGVGNHSMFIDLEGIAAVVNGQSLMDVQQANQLAALQQQHQQQQGSADQASAAAASGPVTMHDALKAAGIVPPSPESSRPQSVAANLVGSAAGAAGLAPVSTSAPLTQQPEGQQQHSEQDDGACCPLAVPGGVAVADDGLLLCEVDAAGAAQDGGPHTLQQQQEMLALAAADVDPSAGAPPGMVTRRRASAAAGASGGSSSGDIEAASAGDGTATSNKGAPRQQDSSNSRKRGTARASKPTAKCRAPLPSVEQVMLSGGPGSAGKKAASSKPNSRVPLPPPSALPTLTGMGPPRGMVGRALRDLVAAPGTSGTAATAAPAAANGNGGLQRFTLPNGQTVYVAAAKPGATAAPVHGRPQAQHSLQQQPIQPASQQLLHQQLLQQQALQLALLQQQQQSIQAGDAAGTPAGVGIMSASAALVAPPISASDTAVATACEATAPTAAELAAAVNRLRDGLPGGSGLSGLMTPGFLSPTGLLSPVTGAGAAVVAGGHAATLDSLEALLADKDFGFFSPEKGNPLLLFNNSSTLAGMMSCLNSPSLQQMQFSPLPPAKRLRAPSALHPQQLQQQRGAPATGSHAADLQSLFHTFPDSGDAAHQAASQAAAGNDGSKPQAPPATAAASAADIGSGPADQQQQQIMVASGDDGQVGELYQYLLGAGGDSWLVPPAGGTGAAGLPAGPAAVTQPGAALNGGTRGSMLAAVQSQAAAMQHVNGNARGPAPAAIMQQNKNSRSCVPAAGGRRAGAANKQQQEQAQHQEQVQQQQQVQLAGGFNPNKPFAALFPSAAD